MPIEILRGGSIVHGADHAIHAAIKAAMLRQARIIRDTVDGTASEAHQRWARQVLGGSDASYPAILRELSQRQVIQDLYTAGGPYNETQAGQIRNNLAAVLDAAIAAQLG